MFCPYLYQQVKMLTGESSPKGTCKSAHISESIIIMKIGPFLKWPGEVGSDGCMFIVCFVPSTFEVTSSFFHILYFSYLLWNLGFYFLVWVCYTADCNAFTLRWSSCSSILCEHGSCKSVLPLPLTEAASWNSSAMNMEYTDLPTRHVSSWLGLLTGKCSTWKLTVHWAQYLRCHAVTLVE